MVCVFLKARDALTLGLCSSRIHASLTLAFRLFISFFLDCVHVYAPSSPLILLPLVAIWLLARLRWDGLSQLYIPHNGSSFSPSCTHTRHDVRASRAQFPLSHTSLHTSPLPPVPGSSRSAHRRRTLPRTDTSLVYVYITSPSCWLTNRNTIVLPSIVRPGDWRARPTK